MISTKSKSGYLILIVDDLPESRELRKYILESEGFRGGCNDYLEEPCFEELFEKVLAYILVG